MTRCETCGNEYDGGFEIRVGDTRHAFDCFECAIHALAPSCSRCHCKILGHGLQASDALFCSAHCARLSGVRGLTDHVASHRSSAAAHGHP